MNIKISTYPVLLLLVCFFFTISSVKAQYIYNDVYRDFLHVYEKVREFDMTFKEALPITASKTFIPENEHIRPTLKLYKKEYPSLSEQDLLIELVVDVASHFINENMLQQECKDSYYGLESFITKYESSVCACVGEKENRTPRLEWIKQKDSIIKLCTTSFIKSIGSSDTVLKSKLSNLKSDLKLSLINCAEVYSYVHCETLIDDLIFSCLNRAERYYYFEKGLRMSEIVKIVNETIRNSERKLSRLLFSGFEVSPQSDSVIIRANSTINERAVLSYEIQDWDNTYSVLYSVEDGKVNILFCLNYLFDFHNGKPLISELHYLTEKDMKKNELLSKSLKRLTDEPQTDSSK